MAIEGDTTGFSDDSFALVAKTAPFSPSLKLRNPSNVVLGEDVPDVDEMGISFLQAYVIDYLNKKNKSYTVLDDPFLLNERVVVIENMDKVFKLDYDEANPKPNIFEVKITLDEEGKLEKAELVRRTLVEGEEDYRDESDPDLFSLENSSGPFYAPVCEVVNQTVTRVWQRDNIHWWGDLLAEGASCKPWAPQFENSQEDPALPPIWSIKYGWGTVNGRVHSLYDAPAGINITQQQYDQLRYLYLTVTMNNGAVNTVSIGHSDEPQTVDIDPIQEDLPPSTIYINLGSMYKGSSCIYWKSNISLRPYVYFTETRETWEHGQDRYIFHWKLQVTSED